METEREEGSYTWYKIDFKLKKTVARDKEKEVYCVMIKESIRQEDTIILIICTQYGST